MSDHPTKSFVAREAYVRVVAKRDQWKAERDRLLTASLNSVPEDRLHRVEAERDQLRKALNRIADMQETEWADDPGVAFQAHHYGKKLECIFAITREALR